MKRMLKAMTSIAFAATILVLSPCGAKAAEVQSAALTAEQQALLLQTQAQQVLLAQQQQALLAQQQALIAQQYQAAVQVQNGFLTQHSNAVNQAFMLQQISNLRYQQYKSMVQRSGLDYQDMLLKDYQKYQNEGLKSFLGYNGY